MFLREVVLLFCGNKHKNAAFAVSFVLRLTNVRAKTPKR